MDSTKQEKPSKGFLVDRIILLIVVGLSVIFLGIVIVILVKGGKEKETPQEPVTSDTVTYTVTARFNVDIRSTVPKLEYGNSLAFRSMEELHREVNCTVEVKRDTPPYAWTGCLGDLAFPLSYWAVEPNIEEVEISDFPGVTVRFSLDEGIRVVNAGKTEYSQENVWQFYFLDLNEDRFPELLIEAHDLSGCNDIFYAYDFFHHKDFEYRATGDENVNSLSEYNGLLIERVSQATGTDSRSSINYEFAIQADQLVLVERGPRNIPIAQPENEAGEVFCWFDQDRGDGGTARAIRLPEYPGFYFCVDKCYIRMCYDDGTEKSIFTFNYGIVSIYFADITGDGKRDLCIAESPDNKSRELSVYYWDEQEQKFVSDGIRDDGMHLNVYGPDDIAYWSYAGFYTENGKLLVRMKDPQRQDGQEISLEIVDANSLHEYPIGESDVDENSQWNFTSLRRSRKGEAFSSDRQSLVALEEYPSMIYNPAKCEIYLPDNGIISYAKTAEVEGPWHLDNRTIFADLDGDGIRELLVGEHYVLDSGTASVLAELGAEYKFVWYNDEVWVAWGESHFSEETRMANRLVGKPVLRNGTIEIISAE